MAWYEVRGGRPLDGAVKIQGSKNGALPVLAGALLHRGRTVLHNCPGITDVGYTLEILRSLGCSVTVEKDALILDAAGLDRNRVPESLGEKMRSSVILLGSLLGRFGEACLPYPGGCTIGKRPIDLHLKMLSEMGVTFTEEERGLKASCRRLSGAEFSLPFPSVGATENVILAAVLAEGVTVLSGAAREPEISELCRFLRGKGRDGDDPDRGRFQPGGQRIYFFIGPDCGGDLSFRRSAHQRPGIPGRSGNRDAYRGPEGYRKDRGGGSHESQRDFSRCQGGLPSCGKSGNQPLSGLSDRPSVGPTLGHDRGPGKKRD